MQVPTADWFTVPVPALIDEALFEAVQQQLEENRQRARQQQRGARYLLQGLLVCAQCGYAYYGKPISPSAAKGNPRHYAYYRCIGTDAYRFGGERVCDNLQLRTDRLDQAVWEEVCALLQEPKRLEQEYQRRLQATSKDQDALALLQAQSTKLRQGIARLIDTYTEGLIDKQEFEPRLSRLRQRLSELDTKAQQLTAETTRQAELRLVITQLEDLAAKVNDGLANCDWLTRRELIRTLVQSVRIGKDEVTVVFRLPPDPFEVSPEKGFLQHCGNCKWPPLRRACFRLRYYPIRQHPGFQVLID